MAIVKNEKIIGIDLGTTNSCVAILEGESVRILENDESGIGRGHITPSVVAFDKDARPCNVGEPAKNQMISNDGISVLYAFKRLIGRRFGDEAVQLDIKNLPYDIIEADNGDAWIEVNGKRKSPLEISSHVLRKIKEFAEKKLCEPVKSAVITVPAYFNNSQRQATKEAGRIAGLHVRRIINEPTAAALAYRMGRGNRNSRIAIYDLGGGTFDISIIEIDGEHQVNVMSINGDTHLGGEDFDSRIIDYLCDGFKREHAMDLRDSDDPLTLIRLKEEAEKAKISLSFSKQKDINILFIASDEGGPKHLKTNLTRAKLELLVEDLIDRTMESCRVAMEDAGVSASDIDEVILVGGQTRMPKVQEAVESTFGKKPRQDINPDEAVALGAAIQGGILAGDVEDFDVEDCTPLSLGVETLGGIMTKIIEKNTKIPVTVSKSFKTIYDNQTEVTVSVFQGEREQVEGNKLLGQFDFKEIPSAPRGKEPIKVIFDIDEDGILSVSAMHEATGKKQSMRITGQPGISEEEIKRIIKDAEIHAEEDRKYRELADARNDAESEIYKAKKILDGFGDLTEQSEKSAIERAIQNLENASRSNSTAVIGSCTKALVELIDNIHLIGDLKASQVKESREFRLPDSTIDRSGRDVWTLLHEAAWNGDFEAVKGLVNAGADPNAANNHGDTPLHLAAFEGHFFVVQELVDAGSKPNAKDEKGETPLHKAAWNGDFEVAKELVNAGADPNAANNHGDTPLHLAAFKGHFFVVQKLIDAGSEPNAKEEKGATPLHNAAYSGHFGSIKALVNVGANVEATLPDGTKPSDIAAEQGHSETFSAAVAAAKRAD